MRFEVEYLEELRPRPSLHVRVGQLAAGSDWMPAGEADAEGNQAAQHAVRQRARSAGWYRARPNVQAEARWDHFHVTPHPETGEPVVRYSEVPPGL
jgi:hypothetical protein